MAVNLLEKLRELLTVADEEDEDQTPEGDATDEADTENPDAAADPETAIADEADAVADDTENETLPDSEVSVAELRDALNVLAAENEALRTRIAELGGDTEVEIAVAEAETDDEDVEDAEDDESAQADIDRQKTEIAALRDEN